MPGAYDVRRAFSVAMPATGEPVPLRFVHSLRGLSSGPTKVEFVYSAPLGMGFGAEVGRQVVFYVEIPPKPSVATHHLMLEPIGPPPDVAVVQVSLLIRSPEELPFLYVEGDQSVGHEVASEVFLGPGAPGSVRRAYDGRLETASEGTPEPEVPGSLRKEINVFVSLSSLRLDKVRSFDALELDFCPPAHSEDAEPGQWIVMLGDNGVGKSTLLRALALALVDPGVATALLQTQETWAPFVKLGHQVAEIEAGLANLPPYHVRLYSGRPAEKLESFGSNDYQPAIFAYGPRRGSAVGGSSRKASFSSTGAVASLFREEAELIHAETWLQNLRLGALESRGGPGEAFYEAVRATLLGLLPGVDELEVSSRWGVTLSGPAVGTEPVPLSVLSDGYLGTLGWALDFLARWSERFQRLDGRSPDGEIAAQATGLVLIDEIGLHLHPVWQIEVVRSVRQMFPRVSFVVTSHHPLILLGARKGEVHVVRKNLKTNLVEIRQQDVPPGTSADDILTGYWFNLSSTLDEQTRKLLEQHRRMLRAGIDESSPERLRLEAKLRRRLGAFATTSIDRMAQSVVAEVVSSEPPAAITEEQKRVIRDRMLEKLNASETL